MVGSVQASTKWNAEGGSYITGYANLNTTSLPHANHLHCNELNASNETWLQLNLLSPCTIIHSWQRCRFKLRLAWDDWMGSLSTCETKETKRSTRSSLQVQGYSTPPRHSWHLTLLLHCIFPLKSATSASAPTTKSTLRRWQIDLNQHQHRIW